MLNKTAVTMVSGAKPFKYAKPFWITEASVEKKDASRSPLNQMRVKTRQPKIRPMPIPVNMDFLARFRLPAPTFWETKDAMDCIRELGISIAKLTILQATP